MLIYKYGQRRPSYERNSHGTVRRGNGRGSPRHVRQEGVRAALEVAPSLGRALRGGTRRGQHAPDLLPRRALRGRRRPVGRLVTTLVVDPSGATSSPGSTTDTSHLGEIFSLSKKDQRMLIFLVWYGRKDLNLHVRRH
jgi:hypothetical protein